MDEARASRLARLQVDIADAEQRVTEQALRYEMLEFDGQDARQAMELLRTFEAIYVELVKYRQTLSGTPRSAAVQNPPDPPGEP